MDGWVFGFEVIEFVGEGEIVEQDWQCYCLLLEYDFGEFYIVFVDMFYQYVECGEENG